MATSPRFTETDRRHLAGHLDDIESYAAGLSDPAYPDHTHVSDVAAGFDCPACVAEDLARKREDLPTDASIAIAHRVKRIRELLGIPSGKEV